MIKKDLNELKPLIRKSINNALEQTAIELNYMIEIMYGQAIDAFYNSYEPDYYRRTFSTYYGSDLYDNPQINVATKMGNDYIAGITVSSDNIPGHPYNRSPKDYPNKTEWVFNRTYQFGIHGTTMIERRQWGKNKYWDQYRRIVQKRNSKYMINQYNLNFKQNTNEKISNSQLSALNKESRDAAKNVGVNFKDFKSISGVKPPTIQWSRGQMTGKKPKQLMEASFTKMKQSQQINNIIFQNVLNSLMSGGKKVR